MTIDYPKGWIRPTGPSNARVVLIGEAPGEEELKQLKPFVGASGQELDKMMSQAGLLRSETFITNLVGFRPPGNDITAFFKETRDGYTPNDIGQLGLSILWRELGMVRPDVIICAGNVPTWAVTGESGITRWRGSSIIITPPWGGECVVVPTYHPAAVLRQWSWRTPAVHDFRRVAKILQDRSLAYPPEKDYILRPSFEQAMDILGMIKDKHYAEVSNDIETKQGHIACSGFGYTEKNAICIPFFKLSNQLGVLFEPYWTEQEELEIVLRIKELFATDTAFVGQNFSYDMQYYARHWGFIPRVVEDTMTAHHVSWCELPNALYFQASIYCDRYVYWKDEGKEWNPKIHTDEKLWEYNCDDCQRTLEIWQHQKKDLERFGLREVYEFQKVRGENTFRAMLRGARVDRKMKAELSGDLYEYIEALNYQVLRLTGRQLNPRSPKQMKAYFYDELGLPKQYNFKKGKRVLTLDDNALTTLCKKEPLVRRLIGLIQNIRSAGVFRSTFLEMKLDHDGRARCSYNVSGTNTFRLSSSTDAFGYGTNLQNIPKGDDDEWKPQYDFEVPLPQVKKIFAPDPGKTWFEMDLDRADLQVVVWEADDDMLRLLLREGLDIHLSNARDLFHLPFELDELRDAVRRDVLSKRFGKQRQIAKMFVHGTNYGGSATTMAKNCKIPVVESERSQRNWFAAHPGIKEWHRRTEDELYSTRTVRNKFGYRRYFFDRIEGLLPEALAWVPQSTVGIVIDKAWDNIERNLPEVEVLLQVHDSLAGQYPSHREGTLLPKIKAESQIVIPYDQPLIIPVGIEVSRVNWGSVERKEW